MKQSKRQFVSLIPMGILACVGALTLITGCGGGSNGNGNGGGGKTNRSAVDVFAMTNESNNRVAAFSRDSTGSLSLAGMFDTQGAGSGSPLDSQGALVLSPDRRYLYVSNPGSDEISVFSVSANNLSFLQKISSGGDLPLSVTMHGDLLYALNSGTGSNISGFRAGSDGRLTPLANSTRMLSTAVGLPAQIQFNPAGTQLVVTQKVTHVIDTYAIGSDGLASGAVPPALAGKQNTSAGTRPFGFAFRPSDSRLVVSESFNVMPGKGAASSYNLAADGTLSVISASVIPHSLFTSLPSGALWVGCPLGGFYPEPD